MSKNIYFFYFANSHYLPSTTFLITIFTALSIFIKDFLLNSSFSLSLFFIILSASILADSSSLSIISFPSFSASSLILPISLLTSPQALSIIISALSSASVTILSAVSLSIFNFFDDLI